MELRRNSILLALCLVLPTVALAEMKTYPWAEYLTDIVNNIDAVLPPGFVLPENFKTDIFNQIPNGTFTMDTERPFCPNRTAAKFTPSSEEIGWESHFHQFVFKMLTNGYQIPKDAARSLLTKQLSPFCQMEQPECSSTTPFRTIDGSCNNLNHVYWGASFRAVERILPSAYENQFDEPRGGNGMSYLPNPRRITTTIHYDVINPDPTITNMVPQLGQFLDHDLSLSPEADKHCCTSDAGATDCFPIPIPTDDNFYSTLSQPQTCMDFTRSTPFCFPGPSGVREQFNILTSFVDASQVYGSDHERGEQLRAHQRGRLATHSQNPNMLPTVAEIEADRNVMIPFMGKYLAGDERVNEMPALTTLHILLVREHNRIAGEIERIRPTWDDEQLFQEARRIIIAEWQNVVFGQYLPVILGNETVTKYDLRVDTGYTTYESTTDPTIFHGFADAAYRFGHTLINGIIQLYRGLNFMGSYELRQNFFESDQVDQNGWDGYNLILGGLIYQNAQTFDPHITTALTNFVLKPRNSEFGADLIARNVQRGREHGIPSYSEYRRFCNLTRFTTSWFPKPVEFHWDTWGRFQSLYSNPTEIDLFTGGISEIPVKGAFSGPTFNCLKAVQFRRVKFGDRFFFTHADQAGSFTPAQLQNIRARTLGDIVCENSNVIDTTLNVFRSFDAASNPRRRCSDTTRARLNYELLLQRN